jgi:hypothetical protein
MAYLIEAPATDSWRRSNPQSLVESHSDGLLEYPSTKFGGAWRALRGAPRAPSGNHAAIASAVTSSLGVPQPRVPVPVAVVEHAVPEDVAPRL